jgi:transposase
MSNHQYTPEFKDEAVKKVVERGYSVSDVSQHLGVSSHSLYKWVKAVQPDKSELQVAELDENQKG